LPRIRSVLYKIVLGYGQCGDLWGVDLWRNRPEAVGGKPMWCTTAMTIDRWASRRWSIRWGLPFALFWSLCAAQQLCAAPSEEAPNVVDPSLAGRPWAALWISSLGRVLAACDLVYDSVDRPDLAESLEERLGNFRSFGGIDRKRPLGILWTWSDTEPIATVFLPVAQIDELMKTATFDVVEFRRVANDRFEIDRPGSPYHVLLRSGYALLGDDPTAMQALRESPDQMTESLQAKYDLVFNLDMRQMPRLAKERWIENLKTQIEPWLQPQDRETIETATIRRTFGVAVLTLANRVILDVRRLTIGCRIDAEKRQISLELIVLGEPGTTMASELNQVVLKKHQFSSLVQSPAMLGVAFNWPLQSLFQNRSRLLKEPPPSLRLNGGVQLVGNSWAEATLIAGLYGPEVAILTGTIPQLLVQLEKSGQGVVSNETPAVHRDVVIRQIVAYKPPPLLSQFLGPRAEVLIGQAPQTMWLAVGDPSSLRMHLQQAIDAVAGTAQDRRDDTLLQSRVVLGKLPLVGTLSEIDSATGSPSEPPAECQLSIEPIRNGLRARAVTERDIFKRIGREWARQVDQLHPVK